MRVRWLDALPARWRAFFIRWGFNFYPSYRATGGRVIYVSPDLRRMRIKLALSWRTRNPAGSLFGGSLYAVTDPLYVWLLAQHLGAGYIVWDKAGSIRYRKPGRSTLFADFGVDEPLLDEIRRQVAAKGEYHRDFPVELKDSHGTVHVEIVKTIYVATKEHYRQKIAAQG